MKMDGEFEEREVDCEECNETFTAPGSWDVESYDICTTRREWFPEEDHPVCDTCKEKPVYNLVIQVKVDCESDINTKIFEDNALLNSLQEILEIPAAHITDFEVTRKDFK